MPRAPGCKQARAYDAHERTVPALESRTGEHPYRAIQSDSRVLAAANEDQRDFIA